MTMNLSFELPFPPSVNTYYRSSFRSRSVYLSKKGREFKDSMERVLIEMKAVYLNLPSFPTERLRIHIELIPGDRRSFDIDNRVKAILDVLEGHLFVNDSQIDELEVIRKPMDKGKARCRVTISVIKEQLNF